MKPSTEKPFCLADFDPFLRSLGESEDHSVVIGGMAVSAWAEMFLEPSEHSAFDLLTNALREHLSRE